MKGRERAALRHRLRAPGDDRFDTALRRPGRRAGVARDLEPA